MSCLEVATIRDFQNRNSYPLVKKKKETEIIFSVIESVFVLLFTHLQEHSSTLNQHV